MVNYTYQDIGVVANNVKTVPREWINAEGNDVTSKMIAYLKPLVSGTNIVPYIDGLPAYLDISNLDNRMQNYAN